MDINSSTHLRRRQAALAARSARHGVVSATTTDALSPTATPSYLASKRQRRGYGDKGSVATSARSSQHDGGEPVAVNQLIRAMLRSHALDWATTQRDNCRTYLLSPTGRFQQWCSAPHPLAHR